MISAIRSTRLEQWKTCSLACRAIRASSQAASPRVKSACARASRCGFGEPGRSRQFVGLRFHGRVLVVVDVAHALRIVDEQDQVRPAFALEEQPNLRQQQAQSDQQNSPTRSPMSGIARTVRRCAGSARGDRPTRRARPRRRRRRRPASGRSAARRSDTGGTPAASGCLPRPPPAGRRTPPRPTAGRGPAGSRGRRRSRRRARGRSRRRRRSTSGTGPRTASSRSTRRRPGVSCGWSIAARRPGSGRAEPPRQQPLGDQQGEHRQQHPPGQGRAAGNGHGRQPRRPAGPARPPFVSASAGSSRGRARPARPRRASAPISSSATEPSQVALAAGRAGRRHVDGEDQVAPRRAETDAIQAALVGVGEAEAGWRSARPRSGTVSVRPSGVCTVASVASTLGGSNSSIGSPTVTRPPRRLHHGEPEQFLHERREARGDRPARPVGVDRAGHEHDPAAMPRPFEYERVGRAAPGRGALLRPVGKRRHQAQDPAGRRHRPASSTRTYCLNRAARRLARSSSPANAVNGGRWNASSSAYGEKKPSAGRCVDADQPGRQQALAVLVQQPVVGLQVHVRAEADDQSAAALQMSFQPGDLALAQPGHVAQKDAIVGRQVAGAGVGELGGVNHLRPGRVGRRGGPTRGTGTGRRPARTPACSYRSAAGLPLTTSTGTGVATVTVSERTSSASRASPSTRT